MRSFREWKTFVVLKLLEIKERYKDDEKVVRDADILLSKLEYLKSRDLASFLLLIHRASVDTKEFLELLPTKEEVEAWFKKGED